MRQMDSDSSSPALTIRFPGSMTTSKRRCQKSNEARLVQSALEWHCVLHDRARVVCMIQTPIDCYQPTKPARLQQELLKYFEIVSGNRSLIFKVDITAPHFNAIRTLLPLTTQSPSVQIMTDIFGLDCTHDNRHKDSLDHCVPK